MAEAQPPNIAEGATTGDIDEEVPIAAKSAEDRKAAAALSSLDSRVDESANTKDVDQAAIKKAMERLGGSGGTNGTAAKRENDKKVVKKAVKVDAADVTLLVRLFWPGEVCELWTMKRDAQLYLLSPPASTKHWLLPRYYPTTRC